MRGGLGEPPPETDALPKVLDTPAKMGLNGSDTSDTTTKADPTTGRDCHCRAIAIAIAAASKTDANQLPQEGFRCATSLAPSG